MSTRKADALEIYEDPKIKKMQVVFLNSHGFSHEEIAKYTNYAISTIKTYINKFAQLLEEAKEFFYHLTNKAKIALRGNRQLVYLYKFYDANEKLICSKVGTTTRLPEQRLKEEIRYYQKHGIEVADAKICSVIDCGDVPAEGAESITRAVFIKKYPNAFCKNDRFFGVNISTKVFNDTVKSYLGE